MAHTVAVTGAAGNVGKELALKLLARGIRVRAIGRSADRLQTLTHQGAETWVGSLEDETFLVKALQGVEAVFAMVPPNYVAPDVRAHQKRIVAAIGSALEKAGVKQAVTLSSIGADLPSGTGPIAGLYDLEQRLNAIAGLNLVHLRAAFFMENHLRSVGLIKSMGLNGSPFKTDLPLPMIATRDIATAAAELLAAPSFSGKSARELLGPRDYSSAEATTILGRAIGKPDLRYLEFPYQEARKAMLGMGFSESMADLFVEMQRAMNEGRLVVREKRSAANSTPTTLEEFAKTFAAVYNAS